MIGFYDYTVILTYLSLLSACAGIIVSLAGPGHPYIGTFFLLVCGLCDAFDGKVARRKKDRTDAEKAFGIQIDSLSDLVAFGVLPVAIGAAMLRWSPIMLWVRENTPAPVYAAVNVALMAILILFALAALIRLAYFNVTEEERQRVEGGVRKYYQGMPVTTVSLIFPFIQLLQYIIPADVTMMYFATAVLCGFAFLVPVQIRKPGLRGILLMVAIGAVEFSLMLLGRLLK